MENNRFIAISSSNGITFFSRIFPHLAVESYYDENDKIKNDVILNTSNIKSESSVTPTQVCQILELNRYASFITLILATTIALFSNRLNMVNIGIIGAMIYFIQKDLFVLYFFNIFNVINFKSKNGIARKMSRFHGAEHKALNAYEKLERVPTAQEVKKASRIAKDCGSLIYFNRIVLDTMFCFLIIVYSIVIVPITERVIENYEKSNHVLYGRDDITFKIVIGIAVFILFMIIHATISNIVAKNSILRFLEVLVTEEPTEREINLAIKGLEILETTEYILLEGLLSEKIKADMFEEFENKSNKSD